MRAKPILYTIFFSLACLFASTSKADEVTYEEILQHVGENLPAGWKMQETPNGIFPNTRDNLRQLTESLPASTSLLPGTFAHKASAIIAAWQYNPQLWQSNYCFHDGMAVLANVNHRFVVEMLPRVALPDAVAKQIGPLSNPCGHHDAGASASYIYRQQLDRDPQAMTVWHKTDQARTNPQRLLHKTVPKKVRSNVERRLPQATKADKLLEAAQMQVYRSHLTPDVAVAPIRHLRALTSCYLTSTLQPELARNIAFDNYIVAIRDQNFEESTNPALQVSLIPQPIYKSWHMDPKTQPAPTNLEDYVLPRREVTHCIVDPRDFMVLGRYQEDSPYFLGEAERPNAQHP